MTPDSTVLARCGLCRSLALLSVICIGVGPLLSHFEWVAPLRGFLVFSFGLLLGAAAFVATVVAATLRRGRFDWPAFFSSLALALLLAASLISSRHYPRINDITTDWEHPPAFVQAKSLAANRGRDLSYPGEAFAREQSKHYPRIAPLRVSATPDVTFEHAVRVARSMPAWELTRVDPMAHAIEGVATTKVFRFRDDFVIEVRPDGSGSVVQMRSKSRDGRSDVGANAVRIDGFLEALRKSLGGESKLPH